MVCLASAFSAVSLALILRQTGMLQSRLISLEDRNIELSRQLGDQNRAVNDRLDKALSALEKGFADSRARTEKDVNGLEGRIQRSMSSVQSRLKELMAQTRSASTPSPSPVSRGSTALAEAPQTDAPEQRDAQDLPLIQTWKEGMDLYREARYAEAVKKLASVVDKQPDNVEARLYKAAATYRARPGESSNYGKIESDLRIVIQTRREEPLAMEILGLVNAEKGRWQDSLDWLSQAVALEPENVRLLKETAACAAYAGKGDLAESYWDRACAVSPKDAFLWHEAGRAYAADAKYQEALQRISKSLDLEPGNAQAKLDLGRAYLKMGEQKKGETVLKELIQSHPGTDASMAAAKELGKGTTATP